MKRYIAEMSLVKEFDGMKNIEKKIIYFHRLKWDWQEGLYVKDVYGWREIEIYDLKHLKNWIKKYENKAILENENEAIQYFKNGAV